MSKQLPILEKNQRGQRGLSISLHFVCKLSSHRFCVKILFSSLNLDSSHFSSETRIGMSPVDGSLQSRSWNGAEKGREQPYHASHMSLAWVKEEN